MMMSKVGGKKKTKKNGRRLRATHAPNVTLLMPIIHFLFYFPPLSPCWSSCCSWRHPSFFFSFPPSICTAPLLFPPTTSIILIFSFFVFSSAFLFFLMKRPYSRSQQSDLYAHGARSYRIFQHVYNKRLTSISNKRWTPITICNYISSCSCSTIYTCITYYKVDFVNGVLFYYYYYISYI